MKSITAKEKVDIFEEELKLIYNSKVREFTRLCLLSAPDYFFVNCPASTGGKHHPLDESGYDGVVIHTKRVVTLAYLLATAYGCVDNQDLVISASIIHDLVKQGRPSSGHTVKNHPDLGANLVDEVQSATLLLTPEQHSVIRGCVGYHYGLWSSYPWSKPIKDYTIEELCVYTADYIASKKQLVVEYKRRQL